jgi:hypothetical protein
VAGQLPAPRFVARRPRYPRLRRAVPALLMLLALGAGAGTVWWKVLHQRDAKAAADACAAAAALDPHTVKLRVYNASTRQGLARTVATQFTRRGFVVLATANDPLLDLRPVTTGWAEIRYGAAGARQAQLVSAHVPGARLYRDGRKDAIVDVALGQAFKRLSTPAEMAKAMAAIQAGQAGTAQAATARGGRAEATQGIAAAVTTAPARTPAATTAAGTPPKPAGC